MYIQRFVYEIFRCSGPNRCGAFITTFWTANIPDMIGWILSKWAVLKTNDSDLSEGIDVLNLRIVISVAMCFLGVIKKAGNASQMNAPTPKIAQKRTRRLLLKTSGSSRAGNDRESFSSSGKRLV